ncbi:MAG: lipase family alpha/beta hydrolase [Noviherbaspirillum sp.]
MKRFLGKLFTTATLAAAAILPLSAQASIAGILLGQSVQINLVAGTGYTQTKYPIVLVHGILGFDHVGLYEYFYGIPAALRSDGAAVYVSQVSALNKHEVRGEQLLTYIKQIIAATGKPKVNLIGHSQGSPTARYVAAVRPDLVASVTGVDGVNKGSGVADVMVNTLPPGSLSGEVLASIQNAFGQLVALLSPDNQPGTPLPQSWHDAAYALSTPGSNAFNAKFPQGIPTTACGQGAPLVNGVRYFSWSGAQPYTNALDLVDPILAVTSLAMLGQKNDGLVSSCNTHLGQVLRDDYWMNHLDVINQTIGIVDLFEVNPVTLYRQHANRLKNLGL